MRNIFLIGVILSFLYSCQDMEVGYLETEKARFSPDSMWVKIEPDVSPPEMKHNIPNPLFFEFLGYGYTEEELLSWGWTKYYSEMVAGDDYERSLNNIPWVSTSMEGIEGTYPISYRLAGVQKVGGGDVTKFLEHAKMRGDGCLQVSFIHNVEAGDYLVDIEVYNQDHSNIVYEAMRVMVK